MAQASDLDPSEIALAKRRNPALAPHWYSLPRWVWAPLPDNSDEAGKIVSSAVFGGGSDVIDMPRYFRPWDEGLPKLRSQLARLEDCRIAFRRIWLEQWLVPQRLQTRAGKT